MFTFKSPQHKVLHSLKITHGHLKSIINQVERGDNCLEIVHQLKAVQKAIHQVDLLVIHQYLMNNSEDKEVLRHFIDELVPAIRSVKSSSSSLNVRSSNIKYCRERRRLL